MKLFIMIQKQLVKQSAPGAQSIALAMILIFQHQLLLAFLLRNAKNIVREATTISHLLYYKSNSTHQ